MTGTDWDLTERPAAWWRGRRINGATGYHAIVHGPDAGKRFVLVDFHCGSSRVVPMREVEVEAVAEWTKETA